MNPQTHVSDNIEFLKINQKAIREQIKQQNMKTKTLTTNRFRTSTKTNLTAAISTDQNQSTNSKMISKVSQKTSMRNNSTNYESKSK